jgi:preprotein translocase subunit SecF
MEFLKQVPTIRFMALRRYWYWLSALVVVASIALVLVRGLNLTVDFTGGQVFEVAFSAPVDLERARAALSGAGFEDFQVLLLDRISRPVVDLLGNLDRERWVHRHLGPDALRVGPHELQEGQRRVVVL